MGRLTVAIPGCASWHLGKQQRETYTLRSGVTAGVQQYARLILITAGAREKSTPCFRQSLPPPSHLAPRVAPPVRPARPTTEQHPALHYITLSREHLLHVTMRSPK